MSLVMQSEVESFDDAGIQDWKAEAGRELLSFLRPPSAFPCFFSQNSCARGKILFSFVEGLDEAFLLEAAHDLSDYVGISRRWDGEVANAQPLAMLFNPHAVSETSTRSYHELGWAVLQFWHDIDPASWPSNVGRDPNSPFWTMCYDGMQLFVNMSNPAHQARRSRNLGRALTFVINPREVFDIVAGDNEAGHKIRAQIRRRISIYDGQEPSPKLGSFQAGQLEWWQYGLEEDNRPVEMACPFRTKRADA